ncbi:MAG: hypothetical protein AAF384_09495 [Pseudomonadota bacterium]
MNKGQTAEDAVDVYSEPDHECLYDNRHVYAYRVRIAPGQQTLWHRHTEDTIYFSLASGRGHEELIDVPTKVTELPCGGIFSRLHKNQPLVHRVSNVGERDFNLIGAEARASAATSPPNLPLNAILETARFVVYEISSFFELTNGERVTGLLVSTVNQKSPALNVGESRWLQDSAAVGLARGFQGFLAVWR